jgi:mannose-6-phosphate isomerase-like protein (cupin superfamily)
MDAFDLADLLDRQVASGRPYLEFVRSADLSVGLYVLPAGAVDRQQPHTEDEVYVVMSGRATVRVGDEDRPVRPGAVVFVAAGVEHRFHSIEEDLHLLVAFGPAEESRARRHAG